MNNYDFWLRVPFELRITNQTFLSKVAQYQTQLQSIQMQLEAAKIDLVRLIKRTYASILAGPTAGEDESTDADSQLGSDDQGAVDINEASRSVIVVCR